MTESLWYVGYLQTLIHFKIRAGVPIESGIPGSSGANLRVPRNTCTSNACSDS